MKWNTLRNFVVVVLLFTGAALGQIPSNAMSSGYLNLSSDWLWEHDDGTPGTSTGQLTLGINTPSLDNQSAKFTMSYTNYGGERYHLFFASDTVATYFVYDTYVYLTDPSQVQNVEFDMNQVLATGETIIFATQCSSISGTWEYSYITGGSTGGQPHWKPSNIACNPQNWAPRKWHHVQIQTHRSNTGDGDIVTHDWVKLDNAKAKNFNNAVAPSGLFLNWDIGRLLVNFQVDGANATSGSITGYFDEMQVYRW
jgi:hypothetical protein